jgi:hypothetical protein
MTTRVNKFLSVAGIFTALSLLYVYQQTEVFRLAYTGQKKQVACQTIANKNSLLRYSIDRKTSLICLGNKISESTEFQMPDRYQYVQVSAVRKQARPASDLFGKESFVGKLFGLKREAQAQALNP